MKHLLSVIILAVCLLSCSGHSHYRDTLSQVESYIEERHSLELKNIQDKERSDRRPLAAIGVIIIFLSLLIIIRYRLKVKTVESELAKQEKEKYRLMYKQIEQERDRLTDLLESNDELEGAAKNALSERLSLLNRFFLAYTSFLLFGRTP